MDKIEIKHSCIIVNNYNLGDSFRLEKFFSVWDKLTHRYYPKAIKYNKSTKQLFLPRGIDVSFVERCIGDNAILNKKFDEYDNIDPILIKYLPKDEVQEEALKFILGYGKYDFTRKKSQLSLNLNPGAGKTYLTIAAVSVLLIRSIMITSSIDWINQWKNCILEYTNISENEIYLLIGSGSIARLLNGMNDINNYKFILASHATIKSFGDKYGWDKVGELFKLMKVGIKIYDEAHLEFDNICSIDFATNTMKTLYLTATPARSDQNENVIYQTAFKNVPAIDLFDDEKDPRTEYVSISFSSHPSPSILQNCRNAYGFDRLSYINYIITSPNFYKIIYIILEIISNKGKTLIYIGTNFAINIIYNWMVFTFPEIANQIGIYTSITPKAIKKQQLDKSIILSTTKSCGAAIDIKGLKCTVVLAEPFKSEVLARQTLGRTRDRNTMYIEVVDRGFPAITSYYRDKKKIFSVYATGMKTLRLNDYDLDCMYQKILDKRFALLNIKNKGYKQVIERVKK